MEMFGNLSKRPVNSQKRFIYFMTDRNRSSIVVGISDNLINTINKFKAIPALHFDLGRNYSRLVYFEEFENEALLQKRFEFLQHLTKAQKEKIIRSVNADWTDLSLGIDFEKILNPDYSFKSRVYSSVTLQ